MAKYISEHLWSLSILSIIPITVITVLLVKVFISFGLWVIPLVLVFAFLPSIILGLIAYRYETKQGIN